MRLLVIGKYANPRCVKGVKTLPVQYEANRKAWMLSDIFVNWLNKLDKRVFYEGGRMAMVVDNCPSHPKVNSQLKTIRLVFSPPNTTALLPCDQGIIRNLMANQRHLEKNGLCYFDNKEEFTLLYCN